MITKLTKHNNCKVIIKPAVKPHKSGLYCKDCNIWIQWLSQKDLNTLYKYYGDKLYDNSRNIHIPG